MSDSTERKVSSVCAECGASVSFLPGDATVRCQFCSATLAVERGSRALLMRCPRCDGNFYSLDGGLSGECPFCSTPVIAVTRGQLNRFVIRPRVDGPANEAGSQPDCELLFVPFWQLTGLIYGFDVGAHVTYETEANQGYSAASNEPESQRLAAVIRHDSGPQKMFRSRVVERWLADPSTLALGIQSLRLRAAIYPVEPYGDELTALGTFLPAALEPEDARYGLQSLAMMLGHAGDGLTRLDCQRQDLVAETYSLLYYPFFVRGRDRGGALEIWDGVSGEREHLHPQRPEPRGPFTSGFDQLRVLELRCQRCGEKLKPANRARVFPCHNCDTFWEATAAGLAPFSARYARPHEPLAGETLVWLPFWRVATEVRFCERVAKHVIDARNVLGIFNAGVDSERASDAGDVLCYYVPAYGALRAPRLDHVARDMTRTQPRLEPGSYQRGDDFGCFFGPDDARRLAYVVWLQQLSVSVPRKVASLRIETGDVSLWYVPFADGGRELKNLLIGRRYDRTLFGGLGH